MFLALHGDDLFFYLLRHGKHEWEGFGIGMSRT